jgi:hypothetical protein
MKKKMERIDGELFRPLTLPEQKQIHGGATATASTIRETYTSSGGDFVRDGDTD